MKAKIIAMMEIAIVLCSVLLVAIPAIATGQNQEIHEVSASEVTTASEDDYVLEIYSNANEDDTIDMGDVVYTKLAIFGKKSKTELCDAKYDGRINVLDVIQTKLIILGKEKEITFVDADDRIVTVKKPITRIVAAYCHAFTPLQTLEATDRVVGISHGVAWSPGSGHVYDIIYPVLVDLPDVGMERALDYEAILQLQPDLVLIRPNRDADYKKIKELDPDIAVVCLYLYKSYDRTSYVADTKKLGYILDRKDEAEEFIDYYEGFLDTIEEYVSDIPEEDKPQVYYECSPVGAYRTGGSGSSVDSLIVAAGGKNIFSDITESTVSAEDVIQRNPGVILKTGRIPGKVIDSGYLTDDITGLKTVRDEITSRAELQHVTAVREGKVYIISSQIDCCGATGGRYFIAIPYIAKCLHPDIDLDPMALHQEFLTRFQGLDYDLDKHGVFVYHPEQFPGGR